MPSPILRALYEGRRADAEALAADTDALDLLDTAALGDGAAVRARLMRGVTDGLVGRRLHRAAYAGFFGTPDAVAALIAAGADLDIASRNDMAVRPINSAAAGAHPVESVRLLLAAGADVDGRQASGHTALDEALIRDDDAAGRPPPERPPARRQ